MTFDDNVQAIAEADELRSRLGVADDEILNPFESIWGVGAELYFTPLEGTLGVTVTDAGRSSVWITTRRSEHIQRYTAAHELGHIILGHPDSIVDSQSAVFGHTDDPKERAAQLFAASLLAPPYLLAAELGRWAGDPKAPNAADVYQVSRELLISYEATLHQLEKFGQLTRARKESLRGERVADVKQQLGGGIAMQDNRHDLWVREPSAAVAAPMLPGDELLLPGLGGTWTSRAPETVEVVLSHPDELRIKAVGSGPWAVEFGTTTIRGNVRELPDRVNALYLLGTAS